MQPLEHVNTNDITAVVNYGTEQTATVMQIAEDYGTKTSKQEII